MANPIGCLDCKKEYVSSLKIAYKELGIATKPRGTFMASNTKGV